MCSFFVHAQDKFALGVEGAYDFQTNGFGVGIRGYIPLTSRIAVVPQILYFMPFNEIHELYAGASVQYKLFYIKKFVVYPLVAGSYNRWINYTDYTPPKARLDNWAGEVGLGIMKDKGCLRPFAEQRYNAKWKEFTFHIGLYVSFGDCFGNKHSVCPAYSQTKIRK